jgi:hypothetical protein
MFRMQVSARLLEWPRFCACCMEPTGDRSGFSATRTTGKRVIRTQTHTWEIPVCRACISHSRHFYAAKRIRRTCFTIAAVLLIPACCLGVGAGGSAESGKAALFGLPAIGLVLTSGLLVTLGIALYVKRMADARTTARPNCCGLGQCAVYEGWSGSVHSFLFCNRDYADRFYFFNRGKVLG